MRVLVVDDILTNRLLAERMLERRGHSVKTVKNGMEAICLLEQEDFDVVVMDIQMPIMDGIETTKIIRNCKSQVRRHDIPVIAMSAVEECAGKKHCIESGMNGYLAKPLNIDIFYNTLERFAPEFNSPASLD